MFLAFREMRRSLVRFGLLAAAVALLVFLVLIQQALQSGLVDAFVGGLRSQSAPVLVYAVDSQRTLAGSVITPPLAEAVLAVDGVGESSRIGLATVTIRQTDDETLDASVFGTDTPSLGWPAVAEGRTPTSAGEAIGSDADFAVGDVVTIAAAGGGQDVAVSVVGLVVDANLNVTPTLYTDFETYGDAVRALNPNVTDPPVSALGVRPAAGLEPAELAARINTAAPDAEALTRDEAADQAPGVGQVRQSFQVIFALYALVVPLVIGLFFLIVTLQKSRSLTLLRAIGARRSVLAKALLIQVLVITGIGLVLGTAAYAGIARGRLGGLALRYDGGAVRLWSVLFLALAVVGALVSLRRVLRIDPVEATTGGGAR